MDIAADAPTQWRLQFMCGNVASHPLIEGHCTHFIGREGGGGTIHSNGFFVQLNLADRYIRLSVL